MASNPPKLIAEGRWTRQKPGESTIEANRRLMAGIDTEPLPDWYKQPKPRFHKGGRIRGK